MKLQISRAAALACAGLALSACSSVNLWPFGGDKEQDPSRTPAGATAYQCEGGKRLFVRYLDNSAAAWVILPEREFRLNKASALRVCVARSSGETPRTAARHAAV